MHGSEDLKVHTSFSQEKERGSFRLILNGGAILKGEKIYN